ncbi:MAG: hypothetical protein D6806_15845 [Deltaproteobacteria bacterium]|nr:MAG: hypothetical protein D6806_15845 [Deltaproteobacteria bacterium]
MNRNAIIVAFALALGTGGCGLLDSSGGLRIDLPDQTFEFSLDATALVNQLESETGVNLDGITEIPAGVEVNETFATEIPPIPVDLSNQQELKDYIAAGKIKGVTVKYVRVALETNTFNYDIPAVEIFLDEISATSIGANSQKIGVTDPVPAGSTVNGELKFTDNGRQLLSDYLLGLSFAVLGRTEITIDTSASRLVPDGQLAGKITIGLYFTVDPL